MQYRTRDLRSRGLTPRQIFPRSSAGFSMRRLAHFQCSAPRWALRLEACGRYRKSCGRRRSSRCRRGRCREGRSVDGVPSRGDNGDCAGNTAWKYADFGVPRANRECIGRLQLRSERNRSKIRSVRERRERFDMHLAIAPGVETSYPMDHPFPRCGVEPLIRLTRFCAGPSQGRYPSSSRRNLSS
jgi:hypothetical protein